MSFSVWRRAGAKGSRAKKRGSMDNVTVIRVIAGILAAFVFVILIFRIKKKAPR